MRGLIFSLFCLLVSCSAAGPQPERGQAALVIKYYADIKPDTSGGPVVSTLNSTGLPVTRLSANGWVQYEYPPGDGYDAYTVQVFPVQTSEGSPVGEYWVGLQNRSKSRWRWFGPYTSEDQPTFGDYSSVEGNHWWNLTANSNRVIIYCTKPMDMGVVKNGFIGKPTPQH